MRKLAFVVDKPHLNNRPFDLTDTSINVDGFAYAFYLLKQELLYRNYDLSTYDINLIEDSDFIFYLSVNDRLPKPNEKYKSILFIWEPIVIEPSLYDKNIQDKFYKIFTFCDELVDNINFFKLNFSHSIPKSINTNLLNKTKLCCLVAANKFSRHKLELYSKRIDAIRWFEKHAPNDFDLYGRGWEKVIPGNRFLRKFTKLFPYISRPFLKPYTVWRGVIEAKIPMLEKYKFSICYENARDIPGYITEKIFHSFFAGCVPVYWGANNIVDYIPANCFIDKRKFKTYKQLYQYMTTMSDETYKQYLVNIQDYLRSDQVKQFSAEYFVDTIIKRVLNE